VADQQANIGVTLMEGNNRVTHAPISSLNMMEEPTNLPISGTIGRDDFSQYLVDVIWIGPPHNTQY